MNNKNSGREYKNCYEDESEKIEIEFDIDINESDEYLINHMKQSENEDCEDLYKEGFKDGYEKAKQEVLAYMKKNKCCIKCKCKPKVKNKSKFFIKCKHN